jgi:hypothetical protein
LPSTNTTSYSEERTADAAKEARERAESGLPPKARTDEEFAVAVAEEEREESNGVRRDMKATLSSKFDALCTGSFSAQELPRCYAATKVLSEIVQQLLKPVASKGEREKKERAVHRGAERDKELMTKHQCGGPYSARLLDLVGQGVSGQLKAAQDVQSAVAEDDVALARYSADGTVLALAIATEGAEDEEVIAEMCRARAALLGRVV